MDFLETARTKLRRLRTDDLENMVKLESDPDVIRFTPSRFPLTRDQIETRLKSSMEKQKELSPLGIWAAENKSTNEFIGWFMLAKRNHQFPELGFMIVKQSWGRGYTTEIAQRLVHFGLSELKYNGIVAVTDVDNLASKNVLTKLGFKFSKQEKSHDPILKADVLKDHFLLEK